MLGQLPTNAVAWLLAAALMIISSACRPDFFNLRNSSTSDGVSPVPDKDDPDSIGIRAIAPTGGVYSGPVQITLSEIDGRKPIYHVRPFADAKDGVAYVKPFILYPPATLYVGWGKDEKLTHLVHVDYKVQDGIINPELQPLSRFATDAVSANGLSTYVFGSIEKLPGTTLNAFSRLFSPDDVDAAWKHFAGTSVVRHDAKGDVIPSPADLDIEQIAAWTSDAKLNLLLESATSIDPFDGVFGWKVGTISGLSDADAADNAKVSFQPLREILWLKGTLVIRDISSEDATKHHEVPRQNSIVIFRPKGASRIGAVIPWQDLELDPNAVNLAVTGLTRLQLDEKSSIDTTYPVFLDSNLRMQRQSLTNASGRTVTVEFAHLPGSEAGATDHLKYYALAVAGIHEWLGMPVLEAREVPLLNIHAQNGAYGGYNSSAVGVASRLGPFTPPVMVAQLMAHEAAHHVNSLHSATQELWIQEGMSEWFAERFLYRHFSAAVVYAAMRQLRFDRLFENAEAVELPLTEWKDPAKGALYAKALAFFDLLEAAVGAETLREVFQVARQVPLSSEKFRDEVLGRVRTGPTKERARDLFDRWVFRSGLGSAEETNFSDSDTDGLLDWDEIILGTNPDRFDSQANGFSDGERFAGVAKGSPSRVNGLYQAQPHGLIRLATFDAGVVRYQLFPWLNQKNDFAVGTSPMYGPAPLSIRWFIGEQPEIGAGWSGIFEETAYKMTDSGEIPYSVALPQQGILSIPALAMPVVPQTALIGLDGDMPQVMEQTDGMYDVPAEAGSFDLISSHISHTSAEITIRLQTRLPVDSNGYEGNYTIVFQSARWNFFEVETTQDFALHISDGYPHWLRRESESLVEVPLPQGLRLSRSGSIEVTIPLDQLKGWTESDGEKLICPSTKARILGESFWRDDMKCLSWSNPGMSRYVSISVSPMSGLPQRLEIAATKSRYSDANLARTQQILQESVQAIERRLGRAHRERTTWPLRLMASNNGLVYTQSYAQLGGALSVRPGADFDYVLPLAIEQLVRTHLADIRTNGFGSPLWMEDLYAYWLSSSVITEVLGSRIGLRYSHWRMDSYVCFMQNIPGCSAFYAADRSLQSMSQHPELGYSSEKIMMFVHALDAVVGSEGMSTVFRTFALGEWTNRVLLEGLVAVRPDRAQEIREIWQRFVLGTSDSTSDRQYINALFQTNIMNPWLYQFEADAITRAGGNVTLYP